MQRSPFPTPQQGGSSGRSQFLVAGIVVAVAGLVILAFLGSIVYVALRINRERNQVPLDAMKALQGFRGYQTLAESLPASRAAAKHLVEISHKGIVTVSEDQLDKDPSGDFKGYLDFGYRCQITSGFDIGIASNKSSQSESSSTVIAPSHKFFADFRRLKVGQRIVFEEISTNNMPTAKLTWYSADPFLFVRPVKVR